MIYSDGRGFFLLDFYDHINFKYFIIQVKLPYSLTALDLFFQWKNVTELKLSQCSYVTIQHLKSVNKYGVSFFSSSVQELGRLIHFKIFSPESSMNFPHPHLDCSPEYRLWA